MHGELLPMASVCLSALMPACGVPAFMPTYLPTHIYYLPTCLAIHFKILRVRAKICQKLVYMLW